MPAEVLSDFGWGPRKRTFPGAGAGETGTLAREGRNPRRSRRGGGKRLLMAWRRFRGWFRIRQAGSVFVQPSGLPQQPVSRAHAGPRQKLTRVLWVPPRPVVAPRQ